MTPLSSVNAFERFMENRGGSLPSLTVRIGIEAMLSFYESVAPVGCSKGHGDMLLFRWGAYDRGDGVTFEVEITRQFIEAAAVDKEAISQLRLTFGFPPDEKTAGFGNGCRWCQSRTEIQPSREFVVSTPVFLALADLDPPHFWLRYEYV